MGRPKTVDMSVDLEDLDDKDKKAKKPEKEDKKVREKIDIQEKIEEKIEENVETKVKKASKGRSKTYISVRRNVDRTKYYTVKKAVELVTKTSYSKFPGTVVADITTKDDKISLEVAFPHSTGKTTKVAIATDALLKKVEKGQIDFDILIAAPDMMGKIAKFARVLGPKGLMPNPKNKTVTDKPEARKKELEGGKTTIKTEKKMPLMHVIVGKTDQPAIELIANIEHLIKVLDPKKIKKLTLSATMSPGVKVDLTAYQTQS
jgi:large subunit ribosomal protein L1